jgi:predicted dehydrogenase
MQALAASGIAKVEALCDADARRLDAAREALSFSGSAAPAATAPRTCDQFAQLLELPLDGVVIATPNMLHEPQAAAAMEKGIAVFCQKPLAVTAAATERLIRLAKRRNLALGVDWSYRFLAGVPELKAAIEAGELGRITAAELCFHNAYGPDAPWYYDVASSGGGCLLDLGCHLLDLCQWLLGARDPFDVRARCYRGGRRLVPPIREPEDFVMAEVLYASGIDVHVSCSWRASAGQGAIIGCRLFGTQGGAAIRNVGGSFYDFEVELNHGDRSRLLGAPPDAWAGRALVDWAARLQGGAGYAVDTAELAATARVIDRIYGRGTSGAGR